MKILMEAFLQSDESIFHLLLNLLCPKIYLVISYKPLAVVYPHIDPLRTTVMYDKALFT